MKMHLYGGIGVLTLVCMIPQYANAQCKLEAKKATNTSQVGEKSGYPQCNYQKTCYWEWNSFPCESGTYDVFIDAGYEKDSRSPYTFSINGKEEASGKFDYTGGKHSCNDAMERKKHLVKKSVTLKSGDKIKLEGKWVVETCRDPIQGSYFRNHGMIFEIVKKATNLSAVQQVSTDSPLMINANNMEALIKVSSTGSHEVSVVSASGTRVVAKFNSSNQATHRLDLNGIPNGIYTVRLSGEGVEASRLLPILLR